MSANAITTDDSPKKRKICIDGEHQEGETGVKTLKLEESCNDNQSSQLDSSNPESSQASSSQATTNGTQNSNSGSLDYSGKAAETFELSVIKGTSVQNASTSPKKTAEVLHLQQGTVFDEMMKRFSLDPPPTHIIYNGQEYNLTGAFDEFWSKFYGIPGYTKGYKSLIPNDEILTDTQLLVIAKILRRGWEDEHYFPKKLAQPFLEACLFNREEIMNVMMTEKIVREFLEPTHEIIKIIEDNTKSEVDQDILDVYKKLIPELQPLGPEVTEKELQNDKIPSYLNIRAEKVTACIYAVRDHMLNTRASLRIWTDELVGLLELEIFRFLMNPDITVENVEEVDMNDYIKTNAIYTAPHKLWHTFFYGLNRDIIDYYLRMLRSEDSECYYCKKFVQAKYFLSCHKTLSSISIDRHDSILRKIDRELNLAIERKRGTFAAGTDWKRIIMYGNKWNDWPSDLKTSDGNELPSFKHPHIVVYSLTPKKKILIIELSIAWEYWIEYRINEKTKEYMPLTTILEDNGYEVEMYVLVMGSRGAVTPHVYSFFKRILGMKHSDISRTMEKISKKIITKPYNDFVYNSGVNALYQVSN